MFTFKTYEHGYIGYERRVSKTESVSICHALVH